MSTWVVETAIKGDTLDWEIVSGYDREASAKAEVRQLRATWHKTNRVGRSRLIP